MIIESAHQMNIDSKYSNFTIGSCNGMVFNGGYDHVILKSCGKLTYENKLLGELEFRHLVWQCYHYRILPQHRHQRNKTRSHLHQQD